MTVKEKREEKKKQLKSIAVKLFEEDGYEKTRVSNIVKQAGLSQGSFYWYFDSKEDCALEILEDVQQQIKDILSESFNKMPYTVFELQQMKVNMLQQIVALARCEPHLMKVILFEVHSEPIIEKKIVEMKQTLAHRIQQNILQAKESFSMIQKVDAGLHAIFVMSLVESILKRIIANNDYDEEMIDNMIEQMVQFEFKGLFGQ